MQHRFNPSGGQRVVLALDDVRLISPSAVVVAFVTALVAVPATVTAQERQERQGIWGRFIFVIGPANVSTGQTGTPGQTGGGVSMSLGTTVPERRMMVGGEFNFWSKTLETEPATVESYVYNLLGIIAWYPSPAVPWFVKGGGGVLYRDVDSTADGTTVTEDLGTGLGLIAGAGLDFPMGRIWSWTVGVDFWYGHPGAVERAGVPFTSAHQRVIVGTFGVTFH